MAMKVDMTTELAVRAFGVGFVCGVENSQHGGRAGRVVVEPTTHAHWRAGFECGRAAHAVAQDEYRKILAEQSTKRSDDGEPEKT